MFSLYLLVTALCFVSAKPREQHLVVLAPKYITKVLPLMQKCQDESKAPSDAFSKLLKGSVEDDASLKFAYCSLVAAGLFDKDGHIVVSKVVNLLDDGNKEEAAKVYEECNKLNGKDHLETSRLMIKCYKENSPIFFAQ